MTGAPVAKSSVVGRVVGIVVLCLVSTAITVSLGIWILWQILIAAGL